MEALLDRLRDIVGGLPEAIERLSHGAPCFYVRGRALCCFHDADFSHDGRISMWCPAPDGVAEALASAEPARYFRPQPSASGTLGRWLGLYLDEPAGPPDWDDVAAILEEAYRLVAPRSLVGDLDS